MEKTFFVAVALLAASSGSAKEIAFVGSWQERWDFPELCSSCSFQQVQGDIISIYLAAREAESREELTGIFEFVLPAHDQNLDQFTYFIYDPQEGLALTAAHAFHGEKDGQLMWQSELLGTCRSHPCYREVNGEPMAWDVALCKGIRLKVSNGIRLRFGPSSDFLNDGQQLDVLGYGCNEGCDEAGGEPSLDLSAGVLKVDDQAGVHRSLLRLKDPVNRCTKVCKGDSGGVVLANVTGQLAISQDVLVGLDAVRNQSHAVGVISDVDLQGKSYVAVLDDVTRRWMAILEQDFNANLGDFVCPIE